MASELEVVARCAAKCRESTQNSSNLPRGVSLGWMLLLLLVFFPKCLLGSSAIFMMTNNKEQSVCVNFYFLLGKSAAGTVLVMREASKAEAVSKTQVCGWYSRFKGGEISCEDQPRSGWPLTCRNDENLEKVRNAINANRRRIIGEISEITGLSWSSCQRMLTEDLNMKRVSAKFVPRLLTRW